MVTFKDILDRTYVTLVTDYKLDNLKKMDEEVFYTFLSGFLVNSIDMFDGCIQNLSYHKEPITEIRQVSNEDGELIDTVVQVGSYYAFDEELTSKEIYILCLGVAIGWYKKALDDVTQFKIHLSDKNFKSFSEQANLQRRLERLIEMEEELDKQISKYQLNNLNQLPFFGGN